MHQEDAEEATNNQQQICHDHKSIKCVGSIPKRTCGCTVVVRFSRPEIYPPLMQEEGTIKQGKCAILEKSKLTCTVRLVILFMSYQNLEHPILKKMNHRKQSAEAFVKYFTLTLYDFSARLPEKAGVTGVFASLPGCMACLGYIANRVRHSRSSSTILSSSSAYSRFPRRRTYMQVPF